MFSAILRRAGLILLLPALPALAQETGNSAIDELVLGDQYVLDVQRPGGREKYDGELIKVTDKWLVLQQRRESRNECGVPILSKLPYTGRLFRNVGIGRWEEQLWIPRDAAIVQGRIQDEDGVASAEPEGEGPELQRDCSVSLNKVGHLTQGKLTAVADEEIVLSVASTMTTQTPLPVLGKLPLIGGAFNRTQTQEISEDQRIAMADVLCIRMFAPKHASSSQIVD